MSDQKKDRLLTGLIISISVLGAVYFGYQAISDTNETSGENPFEYNIEHFKKSDSTLHHYEEISQISLERNEWYGIAVDITDKIYVTGVNKYQTFDPYRNQSGEYPIDGTGFCIAVGSNGNTYIGLGDHINVYDSTGALKTGITLAGNRPLTTSLAITDSNIFVADAGGHIVWQLDKTGKIIKRIGAKNEKREIPGFVIPSPFFDVAIDPDNFIWAVNPGRHSLENYTSDGGLRSSWGFYSMELPGFCGCCNPTHIAILDDGSFITSEKGIPRIKVYNRIGKLTSVVASAAQFDEGTEGLDMAVDSKQQIYVLDRKRYQIRIFTKIDERDKDA